MDSIYKSKKNGFVGSQLGQQIVAEIDSALDFRQFLWFIWPANTYNLLSPPNPGAYATYILTSKATAPVVLISYGLH